MSLFFVGIVEMIIVASWTKAVSKSNVVQTGMVTTVNILIWYYVLRQVVENLDNWSAIVPYTLGCAIGAMLGAVERKQWAAAFKKLIKLIGLKARLMREGPPAVATKVRMHSDDAI